MRAKPDFHSERYSQMFWGEPARVIGKNKKWLKVKKPDGYTGWVLNSLVEPISPADYRFLTKTTPARLIKTATVTDKPHGASVLPHQIYYGTPVWISSTRNGWARVFWTNDTSYFVRASTLASASALARTKLTGQRLVREARKFLGVPYLWGGISPNGWDCSGLVNTILARFGINIPRDTKDQIKIGRRIKDNERKTGDLIFFERHVGLALGPDQVIHSSLGGGGVRINSLLPDGPNFRQDLVDIYRQTRRIL